MLHRLHFVFPLIAISALVQAAPLAAQQSQDNRAHPPGLTQILNPDPDVGDQSLEGRRKSQLETAKDFKVFYQFQFTDKVTESGITFVQHAVNEAKMNYMANHYDHGNGIPVADVDGDGRYDIYFVNQAGGNQLWRNLGGGKFQNITQDAGVGLADRISVAAAFADVDNDGDQDLFVTTVRGGNVLFENDGHGHFTDISKEAGLDLVSHSSGAFFFDYDNDGLLDLLVCNVGKYTGNEKGPEGEYVGLRDAFQGHMHPDRFEYPVLYRNMGHKHFKDVTAEVGLHPTGWCGDASFTDVNGDGRPDLFFLNMMGHSHYYENVDGQRFVDKTEQYFPKTPFGSMGLKFLDFDNDGRVDLLITDMHSDMFASVEPGREKLKDSAVPPERLLGAPQDSFTFGNALYHNLGNGKFEEVSDRMGVENYWPWGPSVADINADGWDDIFIPSGMGFPFRYGINTMLLNNQGKKFLDAEFLLGIEPRRDGRTHTPWFELDCSEGVSPELMGSLQKFPCKSTKIKVMMMGTLSSRSAAIFDLDQDGDLDIVTNDFNAEPQVLISDLAQQRQIHWVSILLHGTASNRNGLGATVRVHVGDRVYVRQNDGKSGYLSQSVLPMYFGLGDSTKIDRVEVSWPSGRQQVLTSVPANQTLSVTEPSTN